MSETNTKPVEGAQVNPTPQEGDKTFNQEDVNRIVGERLAREKEKASADLEAREKEIAQREFRLKAKETLSEKNMPHELLEALNSTNEEIFIKSIAAIEKYVESKMQAQKELDNAPRFSTGISHQGGKEFWATDSIRDAMGLHR